MVSPLPFHNVRVQQSNLKSCNSNVQSMEFSAHSASILEYQMDILYYNLSLEQKCLPSLSLIEQQPDIKLGMRPLLLDFLMEVITMLNLSKSTFPMTVNLIDRYCSTRIVKKQHYQLLGLTSLWICCKNLDSKYKIPNLNDLRVICVDSYFKELFIEMEKHILKSLDWKINCSTFDCYIDLFLNILIKNNNNPTITSLIKKSLTKIMLLANYLGELFQFYPNIYFDYTSSQIALISIMVSILTLKIPVNLISIIGFFNDTLNCHQFKENLNGDEKFDTILSVNAFHSLFNKSFFKNLIKILNNPPKSLHIKYFKEGGKYTALMSAMIPNIVDNLSLMVETPVTPKTCDLSPVQTMLPLTPISNSTSPKRGEHETKPKPLTNLPMTAEIPYSPESRSSPKKRSFDDMGELINQHSGLKRSKSVNPTFYIT